MERLRSALVTYLDGRGTLARRGYLQVPEALELPRIHTREQMADVLDEFTLNLSDQRGPLLHADGRPGEILRIVLGAFVAAAAKVRSDLAWESRYEEAGATPEEEAFVKGAAQRFHESS